MEFKLLPNTLPSIREVLAKYKIQADKRLGQNFLFDSNITDKIARSQGNLFDKCVIEIGPGPGLLTRSLLNAGAMVIAIEKDRNCYNALNEYLLPFANGRLKLIQGDAFDKEIYNHVPGKKTIIANLPYNISTALLNLWLDDIENFSSFCLMFQKEVADRIMAEPNCKDYGRLSVKVQLLCDINHEFDLLPDMFFPPPKVTSSVISIIPREKKLVDVNVQKLEKLCKAVFGQRRKTLRVSLKQITQNPSVILDKLGIDSNTRPEQLSVIQLCNLANNL